MVTKLKDGRKGMEGEVSARGVKYIWCLKYQYVHSSDCKLWQKTDGRGVRDDRLTVGDVLSISQDRIAWHRRA
jgi:hypothetical protein